MSVVLVTGSSTGIGLATALHFGRLGDGVYAGVRNIATATELPRAIEAEKLPVHPITLDVDDQASVSRAVGDVLAREGLLFYQMQMKTPSQPADVARVIHEAVTTKEPKLRYLVGDDAARLVEGRRKLTDEEYVATGRPMPDAEYLDLMRRCYGFDW